MAIVTRQRSLFYRTAHSNIQKVGDLGLFKPGDLKFVGVSFDSWIEQYGNGRVCVLLKDQTYLFIRQYCRFQREYKHLVWNKLKRLKDVVFDHHLILEVDPHQFFTLYDEYVWINLAWAKLRAWIFKNYGHFEFLRILEPHKSLRPHLHVLISGIRFLDYHRLKREWSERLGCGFVFRKSVRKGFNVLWYVLKYVCKMVKGEVNGKFDRWFAVVLFATNRRLFSMSRGLQKLCTVRRVSAVRSGFTYLGSRSLGVLSLYCLDKKIVFGKFLRVTPSAEDLYANKELFFVDDGG